MVGVLDCQPSSSVTVILIPTYRNISQKNKQLNCMLLLNSIQYIVGHVVFDWCVDYCTVASISRQIRGVTFFLGHPIYEFISVFPVPTEQIYSTRK